MTTPWTHILTAAELEAYYALAAKIDPSHAARRRAFYESRTRVELDTLAYGAWMANDSDGYQMAKTYAEAA